MRLLGSSQPTFQGIFTFIQVGLIVLMMSINCCSLCLIMIDESQVMQIEKELILMGFQSFERIWDYLAACIKEI